MMLNRIRNFYGANPLHLLVLLACFALAGYAALHTLSDGQWPLIMVWFIGAIVAHDLVLFPMYALADRSLGSGLRALRRPGTTTIEHRVAPLNYVRVPALGAGLLFLLFFPGIVRQGADTYLAATGQTQQPFLDRWLLLTAALFTISALVYALRLAFTHRRLDLGGGPAPVDESHTTSPEVSAE